MKRVLFVCMGNICRSPTGEGILQSLVEEQPQSSGIQVQSAGTISYHAGKPADSRMRQAAAKRGYRLDSISRPVTSADFENFDWIIAMDRENLADLKRLRRTLPDTDSIADLFLLSDFLGDEWPTDVPDPYYGGNDGFHYVVEMVEAACKRIIESINAQPSPSSNPRR